MSTKESYKNNFGAGFNTNLQMVIDNWITICPYTGNESFKLFLQIEMDHPTGSNPFFVFEKEAKRVEPRGTENCEIIYGSNMKYYSNDDYTITVTSHSNCEMEWLSFFIDCIKNDRNFVVKEIECGEFFVRVVLK